MFFYLFKFLRVRFCDLVEKRQIEARGRDLLKLKNQRRRNREIFLLSNNSFFYWLISSKSLKNQTYQTFRLYTRNSNTNPSCKRKHLACITKNKGY